MSWPPTALGDAADLLVGFPFKSAGYSQATRDIRLLRGDNVVQGTTRWEGVRRWPEAEGDRYHAYSLIAGDVVLAMDRPWIEAGLKQARIRHDDLPALLVQRVARLRARSGTDQRFLACVVASSRFTDYVKSVQTGTAVPHISGDQIRSFRFPLPPLPTQRAIAEVLGAFDDKLDLNRRITRTADQLARARLASDVRSNVLKRVEDLFDVNPGGIVSRLNVSTIEYIDIGAVDHGELLSSSRLAASAAPSRARRRVRDGDTILSTVRPGRGAFLFMDRPNQSLIVSTGFAVLRPRKSHVATSYFAVTNPSVIVDLDRLAHGGAYPALRPNEVSRVKLRVPDQGRWDELERSLAPLLRLQHALAKQNRTLAELRDLLLPRLISGEIRVREAADAIDSAG